MTDIIPADHNLNIKVTFEDIEIREDFKIQFQKFIADFEFRNMIDRSEDYVQITED